MMPPVSGHEECMDHCLIHCKLGSLPKSEVVSWDWCLLLYLFSYATHIAGFRFGIFLKTDFFQCH